MKDLFEVIKREARIIKGDSSILMIIIGAPLFFAFFYGSVYINKSENSLPVVIVDNDRSSLSRELVRNLDANSFISIYGTTGNYSEAKGMIEESEVQGMIYIPEKFEVDVKSGMGSFVKAYLNTTRFLVSNDINKGLNDVIGEMNNRLKTDVLTKAGISVKTAEITANPVELDMRNMFNITDTYGDFILPGLLALILHQTLLIGLGISTAKERETGIAEELKGKNIFSVVFGKIIPYLVLYMGLSFLFFTAIFGMFKLEMAGNLILLLGISLIELTGVSFIAIFVASFFRKRANIMLMLAFTSIPLFLISGYSWPLSSMPGYIKLISFLLPSSHYLDAIVKISHMDAGIENLLPQIFSLAGLTILFFAAASLRMKKISR